MMDYAKRLMELRDSDFKSHKAELHANVGMNVIRWGRPGSVICLMCFRFGGGMLIVTGDMGQAIYRVSRVQGPEFWASTDLGYFHGKCVASSHGARPMEWDSRQAEKALRERAQGEYGYKLSPFFNDALSVCNFREEWHLWLYEHGAEAFGPDWRDMAGIGSVMSNEVINHWHGLRCAVGQLREKGVLEPAA